MDYTSATPTDQYAPTDFETQHKIEQIIQGFQQARLRRYNFESMWQETAQICWPEWANTFTYGYDQMPGQKKAQQQLDSTAAMASHRFAAIVDSIMTPMQLMWSRLRPSNPELAKNRDAKAYFDEVTARLWAQRYRAHGAFSGQSQMNYQSLGVFGNMNMQTDELTGLVWGNQRGLRYTSIPVGQMFYVPNNQGVVDSYYRAFRWTARQIKQQWPDSFPAALQPALDKQSQQLYWIIEFVCPRDDYVPWRLDAKGKPFASYYISIEGNCLLEEKGYRTFPMAIGRYMVAPDEFYGRGPAQMVLPTMKTLNAAKGTFLKQAHRAGDPIYLTSDSGLIDWKFHPGAVNPGGMNSDGKKLVDILETGQIQITEDMMAKEASIIEDAFLVKLFALALQSEKQPNMNARQVLEFIEQRGVLLAPMVGRQQEYLGTLIPRELDLLSYQKLLPQMPPVVQEAMGEFDIEFTNPLTRAMKASEIASFMRMVEMATQVAQSSNDNTVWDNFDWDVAFPEMADNTAVPVRWMASEEKLAKKRDERAKQAAEEMKMKSLPGLAAMEKAKAITAKAQTGGNIGGTLSGTPEGGMPVVPGNEPGTPGQPGINGGPGTPGQPPQGG